MNPLVLKCYLPGRRAQYVLEQSEDTVLTFGKNGDLCPKGFEDEVRLKLRLVNGQWFAARELGELRRVDGKPLDGLEALVLPTLLSAGSATLVLDGTINQDMPTHKMQERTALPAARAAQAMSPPPPAPKPMSPDDSVEITRVLEVPVMPPTGQAAVRAKSTPPPPLAPNYPASRIAVRPIGRRAAQHSSPALGPELATVVVAQGSSAEEVEAPDDASWEEVPGPRTRGPWFTRRRITAFGVLAVALGAPCMTMLGSLASVGARPGEPVQFRRSPRPAASTSSAPQRASNAIAAPQLQPRSEAKASPQSNPAAARAEARPSHSDSKEHNSSNKPTPPTDLEASYRRAASFYATGDWSNAEREYRSLAARPGADPVFAVIARAVQLRAGNGSAP